MKRASILCQNLLAVCGCIAFAAVLSLNSPPGEVGFEDLSEPVAVESCAAPLQVARVSQRVKRDPTSNPILSCDVISPEFCYDQRRVYRAAEPAAPTYVSHTDWRDPMINPLLL